MKSGSTFAASRRPDIKRVCFYRGGLTLLEALLSCHAARASTEIQPARSRLTRIGSPRPITVTNSDDDEFLCTIRQDGSGRQTEPFQFAESRGTAIGNAANRGGSDVIEVEDLPPSIRRQVGWKQICGNRAVVA